MFQCKTCSDNKFWVDSLTKSKFFDSKVEVKDTTYFFWTKFFNWAVLSNILGEEKKWENQTYIRNSHL